MVRYQLEWIEYDSELDDEVPVTKVFTNKDELIGFLCNLVQYGARVRRL